MSLRKRMKIENGSIINQYKIISAIGKGGMGEVFLAQDTKLDRKVAIKFLNEEFSRDADKLNRFVQEAKAVSALNHPNILIVHEIGESADSNYIVTEFIEGRTLRESLSPKQTISLNQILKIGVQVAEALSAAHSAGIVHRDIKPENIMIRQDGYAKVLDFGLAKLTEQKPKDEVLSEDTTKGLVKTNPGMVMGTVSYMSPEQARGKETDARTDIWSLGVVLYEMLSGKVPFMGETINHTIVSILEKEPLLLENIPDELQRIVRKALTKDKEMRYQTARDLLIDLKNLRRSLDIQGELERSVIPNREANTESLGESATQIYSGKSIEETQGAESRATQNVTTSSSLEYAVTQAKSHKFVTAVVGIILLGIISAVAYSYFFNRPAGGGAPIDSIAVLPFENRSGNADSDYLSEGLAESLIYRLSQLPNLKVSPTSSVFRYKGKETDVQKIGGELGVSAVMTGRILQRGDQLAISVELVDVRNNKLIWGEQYERKMSELLATQREIAATITQKLQLKLSGGEKGLTKKYTDNNEAYQLYLKGRFHFAKRTKEDIFKGIEYFQQAIGLDPNFALAYARIAEAYNQLPGYSYLSPQEAFPQSKAAAKRALEIDPTLAEAHTALANALAVYDWNWTQAEQEFKRAIELDPNNATAHYRYGTEYLASVGRVDEAIVEIKRALEIEPLDLNMMANFARFYMYARQNDKAIEQGRKFLELEPNFATGRLMLGMAYNAGGMHEEAILLSEKPLQAEPTNQFMLYIGGYAYAKQGRRREAEQVVNKFREIAKTQNVVTYFIASIYVALGDKDKAFAELEKAYRERDWWLRFLKIDPLMDSLRDDPRFRDLLRRMNLPE
jgi:eukaryotic-like serine/threonine-protein kinase